MIALILSYALPSSTYSRSEPDPMTVGFKAPIGWIGRDGKAVPDAPFRRSKDGFGAALYLITDGTFFDRWSSPVPGATYGLKPVKRVKRNQFFFTAVLFSNAQVGPDGLCAVSVDITFLRPNGTVSASVPNIVGTTGPRGTNDLKLATGFLKINIEDEEAPGRYQVRAVVHDRIRKVSIPLEASVVVIESGSGR